MPFNRGGTWTQPTEADLLAFEKQIASKPSEIVPTAEMIEAITSNFERDEVCSSSVDIFNIVGKLKGPVDIVIPIYDGLHVLKPCLKSIFERTQWAYNLILVDDCSPDPEIAKYLNSLVGDNIRILRNKKNRGFAPTVNRGVAAGNNPYVCILNSDTIVTKGWLVRQLIALEADSRNVMVNPATNNTALINVPLYTGQNYLDMAHAVSNSLNTPTYNEIMPTGFCLTLQRSLWEEVGPFDPSYTSYGEDTAFWFDAVRQADENGVLKLNRAVIADNAYIFHERSTSFSQLGDKQHTAIRQKSSERFHKLNPDFGSWRQGFNENAAVNHLRNELPKAAFKREYKGHIAWVVKSAAPCGGMSFIVDIVNQLIEEGYDAKVCVVPDNYDPENPPELKVTGNLHTAPILFKTPDEFTSTFTRRVFKTGKVFSAVTELTPLVWKLDRTCPGIQGFNHVQSYDVDLAKILGREDLVDTFSECYKKLPNMVSSRWVADVLRDNGCEVHGVVLPGINHDLFHPRNRENGDERFTIAVLVNNAYAFKGAAWAFEFIKALEPEMNTEIKVIAVGPSALKNIRGVYCMDPLPQAKMASFLGTEVDVLVDPSEIHSYGLPALEALYSGCKVLVRENKGIHEYEKAWAGRVTIEEDPKVAADKVIRMSLPNNIWDRKLKVLPAVDRAENVRKFIDCVYPVEKIEIPRHKIEVITPHLRKHGGPTTIISKALQLKNIGHDVQISTVYTDWNPEVINMARGINIRTNWETIPEDTEVVIINSDNPFAQAIMEKSPDKKYIMLKLSHNPRFKKIENDNLNLPWNHIVTTTNWLRDVCINPVVDEDWTHEAWSPDKVTTIGWYHYGHEIFSMPPTNRTYGNAEVGFRLGTLIHSYPLKGTQDAINAISGLKKKYEASFGPVGFGEGKAKLPQYIQYIKNASRENMAFVFKQLDVWLGASHSEGLGRLPLEAMSAGMAVVTTDTGAEFLKHEENCLLFPVGDAQAGAEAVDRLVNDQELFSNIVVNGYNTAVEAADPKTMRRNLNNVIEKVLNND